MKKLSLSCLISIDLALGTLNTPAHAGTATYLDEDFINNGTYVCLTNGLSETFYGPLIYTNSAGTGNGIYGTNIWYYSFSQFTNVLTGTTNSNGQTPASLAGAFCDVGLWPDGNGNPDTNLVIMATFGITNGYPNPYVMSPILQNTIWTNPAPYAGIASGTLCTNTVSFVFSPVSDMRASSADVASGRTFTWSPNLVGLTPPVTLSFTPPPADLIGARRLRLVSITVGTNLNAGAQGLVLDALRLQGWSP